MRLRADDASERLIGIRTNDADVAEELRDRLGSLVADAEPFGYPNVSLKIGARRGRVTDAHIVSRRNVEAFRSFSREHAIDAALAQVHTFGPHPDGFTPLNARALTRAGSVVLVSDSLASAVDAHHRRLSAAGFTVVPHTPVLVDAGTGDALLPSGGDIGEPVLVRAPISHVVAAAPRRGADASPSVGLLEIKSLVAGPRRPLRAAELQRLYALISIVPVVRIDSWEPRRVVAALIDL